MMRNESPIQAKLGWESTISRRLSMGLRAPNAMSNCATFFTQSSKIHTLLFSTAMWNNPMMALAHKIKSMTESESA